MQIATLRDARAEMARYRVTQMRLAKQLGINQSLLSHMFTAEPLVDLTPAGAARIAEAIESLSREAVAS